MSLNARLNIRQTCLSIHRYSGLFIVLFLVIAGFTGSLLVFNSEIDDWVNRDLVYLGTDTPANVSHFANLDTGLDIESESKLIASAHDTIISTYPNYKFSSMPTKIEPNKSLVFLVDYAWGEAAKRLPKAPFDTVYVNPVNSQIVGVRDTTAWAWRNVMPKVFEVHRSLLLGDAGRLLLGFVALIWTVNCFIGFYLTLPRALIKRPANHSKPSSTKPSAISTTAIRHYLKRWRPAWRIRLPNLAKPKSMKQQLFKLSYDIHHAFGLWLWAMLFVLAWSSVKFNLNPVYDSVMEVVVRLEPWSAQTVATDDSDTNIEVRLKAPANQKIGTAYLINEQSADYQITKANSVAQLRRLAQNETKKVDAQIEQNLAMRWDKDKQQWQMRFTTDKDIGQYSGASSLTVDALTGDIVRTNLGFQTDNAHKIDYWLASLHMGHVGLGENETVVHRSYQIFLMLVGWAITLLSLSGVYLWYKKNIRR